MSKNKFFHPVRTVGYSASHSPEWNVLKGRSKGLNYLTIGKELEALATVNHKKNPHIASVFRKAARIAYKRHDEHE